MPDVRSGLQPTFKAADACCLDRLKGEQGTAHPAPVMPSWLSCDGKGPCAADFSAERASTAAAGATARGLSAAGPD